MKILIITEANEKVASGHLMESIALYKKLVANNIEALILRNHDMPCLWGKKLESIDNATYSFSLYQGMEEILKHLKDNAYDVIVTDLREIQNEQLLRIKKVFQGKIICLDEWGNRFLNCHAIVNNMADRSFWDYKDSTARIYAGAQYLILNSALRNYHEKKKVISQEIRNVVITMGGVDSNNNTQKIYDIIKEIDSIKTINIVLGGGYRNEEKIRQSVETDLRCVVHKDIDYLFELIYDADVAFCAGGNTMYEIACIGTPAIVVPTMPHEEINGRAFQRAGFGHVFVRDDMKEILPFMLSFDQKMRAQMSGCGKKLIDGNGVERVLQIILALRRK